MAASSSLIEQRSAATRLIADRAAAAMLAALVLAGSPQATGAQVLPPSVLPGLGASGHHRVPVDPAEAPWRAVVRVQTELGGRCSGALIAPRAVLTAAHCVFARNTGQLLQPGSVHVLAGYERGDYTGHARATFLRIGPGFGIGPGSRRLASAPPHADWAVLSLDAPLGAGRSLPLLPQVPPAGTPAMLGGFEQDRPEVPLADTACAITGAASDAAGGVMLRHSCAATRGASGAPLLARAPGGGWAIAGVASLGTLGSAGGYAVSSIAVNADIAATARSKRIGAPETEGRGGP